MSKKAYINILKVVVLFVLFYIFLKLTILPYIVSEEFRSFASSLGVLGYFIVVGYTVLSHVLAPLAGTPGVLLGITIYGLEVGMLLLYVASLISAVINFYISRRFGRGLVEKLVGKKLLEEIDLFTKVEGKQVLIVSRLLGFSVFEFISYAAGLTNMSFKSYFVITAVVTVITQFLAYLLFRQVDFNSEMGILIWMGSIVLIGVIFGVLVRSYIKSRKY